MMNRWRTHTFFRDPVFRLVGMAFMTLVALASGCGKKAPPVVPQQTPLVAVTDLRATADAQDVILTWRHSPENSRAAGYLVLRAQKALTQPECPACPQVFRKIQGLRMSGTQRRKEHTLTFTQALSPGFRYTYSVRPYHRSGAQGPDSNLVEISGLPSGGTRRQVPNP